jgi:hypothetical protein
MFTRALHRSLIQLLQPHPFSLRLILILSSHLRLGLPSGLLLLAFQLLCESGTNTSTVTLRVVGGDEKGSLESESV